MAGASAPVTLAGAAAVGNAEILAGLVVNQLLEPGRPCIYNLGLAHTLDMRHATAVTGGPENHLLAGVSAAMGRYYDLPSGSWVSTESVTVDSQAALEKAIGFLTHLQSQVSLIWGIGQLESELTFSPAQAVIDDEILAYLRRYRRGVSLTDEDLAVETIREVGIGGSFLDAEHTFSHFRDELFEPRLLFRGRRDAWPGDLADVAEQRVDEMLAAERAPTLSDAQSRELRAIEQDYLRREELSWEG
jgi:trimethylamine--corrinoid protein Co-methyltransferase